DVLSCFPRCHSIHWLCRRRCAHLWWWPRSRDRASARRLRSRREKLCSALSAPCLYRCWGDPPFASGRGTDTERPVWSSVGVGLGRSVDAGDKGDWDMGNAEERREVLATRRSVRECKLLGRDPVPGRDQVIDLARAGTRTTNVEADLRGLDAADIFDAAVLLHVWDFGGDGALPCAGRTDGHLRCLSHGADEGGRFGFVLLLLRLRLDAFFNEAIELARSHDKPVLADDGGGDSSRPGPADHLTGGQPRPTPHPLEPDVFHVASPSTSSSKRS